MTGFATDQLRAGYETGVPQNTAAAPIYQTTAYEFGSLQEAADLFALKSTGNLYSRNASPTQLILEKRVAELEGGAAAAAVGSGQAAVAVALLALATGQGGHIVAANQLYGGTIDLLEYTFTDFGIETTFVDQDDLEAWRAAVRPNTKAFFAESVANPIAQVLDTRAVADIAHEAGVPLVIDNTLPTPYLNRPGDFGADIVVHSATKFLGGHGTSLAGVVVDQGTFDFGADPEKWPQFTAPYDRVGGTINLWENYGQGLALIALIKTKYVHDLGASLSPFNAWQILQGIETLDLRMRRHAENGRAVADFLATHPLVASVNHPELAGSAWRANAETYLAKGAPSVFSFDLRTTGDDASDLANVASFIDGLGLVKLVANIGDARSLVCHPATMTHSHMSPVQREAAGINATTVRLSIGLEEIDDIIADLDQALGLLA